MDEVLKLAEEHVLHGLYSDDIPVDNIWRQAISLYIITLIGGFATYFLFAGLDYYFFFDHNLMKHPKWIKNQVQLELYSSCRSIPFMVAFTVPFFLLEVRGHTKLYDTIENTPAGWGYLAWSLVCFMFWNDCLIYWIHVALHSNLLYSRIHKEHHTWKIPSPFASHAFHCIDGWSQSLPYHLFTFVMPLNKWAYLVAFILVNLWTVSIHDHVYNVPSFLEGILNGSAHHTDHHQYFRYNMGQYFTFWDRVGGTYREPKGVDWSKIDEASRETKGAASDSTESAGNNKKLL